MIVTLFASNEQCICTDVLPLHLFITDCFLKCGEFNLSENLLAKQNFRCSLFHLKSHAQASNLPQSKHRNCTDTALIIWTGTDTGKGYIYLGNNKMNKQNKTETRSQHKEVEEVCSTRSIFESWCSHRHAHASRLVKSYETAKSRGQCWSKRIQNGYNHTQICLVLL